MGRDVYVSATLAGRHSLGPDAVAKACGEVERELRDGTAGSVQFAGGLSPATFATTTFHLSQPAPSGDKAGEDEAAFGCVATRARSETANISIIGERKSAVPAVRETLARALDALSAHCEVLAR